MSIHRRQFMGAVTVAALAPLGRRLAFAVEGALPELQGEVGVTTSSLARQMSPRDGQPRLALLDLPRVMRDELGMRVIDLNTSTLGDSSPQALDRFRDAASDAGCLLTNLKMNQRGLDLSSANRDERRHAIGEYKRSIDIAARLGLLWVRPLPAANVESRRHLVESHQELADYAGERKIGLLIENYGWMESDPRSVVKLIGDIGRNMFACPDTGNWSDNAIRWAALEQTFPHAVTCDFKARQLGPQGEHPLYDLERCFSIGWQAGFRGPWCLEHAHPDRTILFRELRLLRDRLQGWMKSQSRKNAP